MKNSLIYNGMHLKAAKCVALHKSNKGAAPSIRLIRGLRREVFYEIVKNLPLRLKPEHDCEI